LGYLHLETLTAYPRWVNQKEYHRSDFQMVYLRMDCRKVYLRMVIPMASLRWGFQTEFPRLENPKACLPTGCRSESLLRESRKECPLMDCPMAYPRSVTPLTGFLTGFLLTDLRLTVFLQTVNLTACLPMDYQMAFLRLAYPRMVFPHLGYLMGCLRSDYRWVYLQMVSRSVYLRMGYLTAYPRTVIRLELLLKVIRWVSLHSDCRKVCLRSEFPLKEFLRMAYLQMVTQRGFPQMDFQKVFLRSDYRLAIQTGFLPTVNRSGFPHWDFRLELLQMAILTGCLHSDFPTGCLRKDFLMG